MSEKKQSAEHLGKSAEQVEQERLTRRQALRNLGFGAGLSAFMLLGVDDLARMVGKRLQQMDGDNKMAEQVAKEFQSAGIAFAGGANSPCIGNYDCSGCGGAAATGDCCFYSSDPNACCHKNTGGSATACQTCCQHAQLGYGGGGMDQLLRQCLAGCPQVV